MVLRCLFGGCFEGELCESCLPSLLQLFVVWGWLITFQSARLASFEGKISTIIPPFHWNMLIHFSLLYFFSAVPDIIKMAAGLAKSPCCKTYEEFHLERFRRKHHQYLYLRYLGEISDTIHQEFKKLAVFYNPLLSLNAIVLSFVCEPDKIFEQKILFLPTIRVLYQIATYLSAALAAFLAYKLFKSNRSQLISNFRIRSAISQRNEGILSNLHNEAIIHTAILSEYNKAFVHGRIYTLSERMEHSEFKYFQTYSSPERVETLFPRKRLVMKCARCDYESPTTDIALPLCGHTYHEYCFLKMARKDEFGVKCMVCDSLVRQQMIELARAYVRKQEVSVDGQKINPNEGDYSFSNSS